ncbi:hypothetical protein BHE74_00054094 [Ensete ventricosum]|nr:hypothetical protein BHE74_00054094 [Ensete ventricosum]
MTKAIVNGSSIINIGAATMAKEIEALMMEATTRVDEEEAQQGLESGSVSVGTVEAVVTQGYVAVTLLCVAREGSGDVVDPCWGMPQQRLGSKEAGVGDDNRVIEPQNELYRF